MEKTTPNNMAHRRRWARRFALQALYQWQIAQNALDFIEAQFLEEPNRDKADWLYFQEILHGVPAYTADIDAYIKRYIDRTLSEVDPIELSLLRMATYELLKRADVPYRVILNEALELAKTFGAAEGHKFINGTLDKIAREIRRTEITKK